MLRLETVIIEEVCGSDVEILAELDIAITGHREAAIESVDIHSVIIDGDEYIDQITENGTESVFESVVKQWSDWRSEKFEDLVIQAEIEVMAKAMEGAKI